MRVAIQPCGSLEAQEHYQDTIENLVPVSRIVRFLPPEEENALLEVCDTHTAVWGVTRGIRDRNYNKWLKLRAGDIALFYKDGKIFSVGRIVLTMHNVDLAANLWGGNDGQTWECMYFLDDLQEINIPIETYNKSLKYKSKNRVQGFNVHEGEKAETLLELLNFGPEEAPEEPAIDQSLQQQLNELLHTDYDQKTKARKETGILRKHLFGKEPTGCCDICEKELPVGFIVAAHIKPRTDCSDAERRDLNVVMRACRFGCDELFERSYIQVNEKGRIEAGFNLTRSTSDLQEEAEKLIGRKTLAFKEETKGYFEWHRNHPKRKLR